MEELMYKSFSIIKLPPHFETLGNIREKPTWVVGSW